MRRDFLHHELPYVLHHPHSPRPSLYPSALPATFPIERARLHQVPLLTAAMVLATALYGFTVLPTDRLPQALQPAAAHKAWLAVPLTLQLAMAAASNAVFAIVTTLVSDLYPGSGAGSTAVNNLVRCGLAAVGVAIVETMRDNLGLAETFLVLAGGVALCGLLVVPQWMRGMRWREERRMRESEREERGKRGRRGGKGGRCGCF